jgi:hypothetical protein
MEMRKVSRLLVLACAALAASAFSSSALAAYSPSMVVAGSNHATGGGGPVTFNISQAEADDFTAALTLYSPLGYDASLTATSGQIGTASAVVKLHAFGGARVPVTGTVNADDRTKPQYTDPKQNPCSPGLHTAVWTITVSLQGTAVTVPIYVDRITSGPEAAFASTRIRVCFNNPNDRVRNPTGAQLLAVAFSVNAYTNPTAAGVYRWVGLFTPYAASGAPNAAGTIQTQTVQRLPVQLNLAAKKVKRKGKVYAQLSGDLLAADQGVTKNAVQLMSSTRSAKNATKVFKTIRTDSKGRFKVLVPIKKRTWFRAKAVIPSRPVSAGCGPVTIAPCGSVVTAPVGSKAKPLFNRTNVSVRP